MNPLDRLAEARIEEALREGAFEGVPGQGAPLRLDGVDGVPEDVRGAYLLLKGAGYLPPEMELKRETLRLQDLLDACQDEGGRAELRRRRDAALLRFQLLMERRGGRAALGDYAGPIAERLGRAPDGA